jgi:hypothetical protein
MKTVGTNLFTAMAMLTIAFGLSTPNLRAANYDLYIASTLPVGWWGMNETGPVSTTADLSGGYGAANNQAGANLNLSYQGAGTSTVSDQAGYVISSSTNRAAYFDGTSNSGLYGHGATAYDLNVTGAIYRYEPNGFSGEIWINPQLIGGGLDAQRVIATREFGFGFEDTSPAHRLQFTTFGKQDYFSTSSIPLDGNWHQIGFSFDGNVTTTFYIDGALAGTSVGATSGIRTALSPSANTINLGHRNTDVQHFKGYMDEAVLWGTPRTAADFADSFLAATTPVPEPGILALFSLGMLGFVRRRR